MPRPAKCTAPAGNSIASGIPKTKTQCARCARSALDATPQLDRGPCRPPHMLLMSPCAALTASFAQWGDMHVHTATDRFYTNYSCRHGHGVRAD